MFSKELQDDFGWFLLASGATWWRSDCDRRSGHQSLRWPKAASGVGPCCLCESRRAHGSAKFVSQQSSTSEKISLVSPTCSHLLADTKDIYVLDVSISVLWRPLQLMHLSVIKDVLSALDSWQLSVEREVLKFSQLVRWFPSFLGLWTPFLPWNMMKP